MPNIYEENKKYYIKESNYYRGYDVLLKRSTIVLIPNYELKNALVNPKIYTYKELRDEYLK